MTTNYNLKTEKNEIIKEEKTLNPQLTEVYPDAEVRISRNQYSIFEICRMIKDTKEFLLDPDFQRNKVWKRAQECELVESVLMGIPIPTIYLFETTDGIKQVVDGRQRISTFLLFLNNEFALSNLKMLPQFNKMRFQDLPAIYQSKFERYQITVYIIESPTPERLKYDIFDRVNRGGTALNNQEMRNALYFGPATKMLKKISETTAFLKATASGFSPTRMRDQYAILRSLAFYLWKVGRIEYNYKSNVDDFLAVVLQKINEYSQREINELEELYNKSMIQCFELLGENAFRFDTSAEKRRPLSVGLFEALFFFFAHIDLSRVNKKVLEEKILTLKKEFDDSDYFKSRVDSSESVSYRFNKISELLRCKC
jgi:hypothetical protein